MTVEKNKTERVFDTLPTVEAMQESDDLNIGTASWIADKLRVLSNSVGRNLIRLRAQGRAHIHRYTSENCPRAMWVSGTGKDADRNRMTPEEYARHRSELTKRSSAKSKARRAAGIAPIDMNLTPVRELARTLSTIERTRAAPHSWLTPLAELQASDVQMTAPARRRGNGRESQA